MSPPDELLVAFARDLTAAPGSGDTDAREMARTWLRRVAWPRNPGTD